MPLLALAATVMLESGERASLSQAVDGIQNQFHVSDFWIGALPVSLTVVGVLGSIPFGHLADRNKRTLLLAGAMAIWTLVIGVSAFAPTFLFLFAVRLGVGVVEANGPASISLLSDYYPVRDRAKKIGLYNAGGLAGAALGFGLAGVLVDNWGWRAAFWMWIPFGVATVMILLRSPEPARGDQDVDFHLEAESMGGADAIDLVNMVTLPEPTRVGTMNYDNCTWRDAYRELLRIPTMWYGVVGITVSSMLLSGLQFWGVPFFKEVHHLSASKAGAYAIFFGLGAGVGVVSGGFVSDRLLRRGIINARIHVCVFASVACTIAFVPAFASSNLAVTLPLFLIGGFFLTLPLAPADALLTDVVVAPLRGRAAALRSIVRSVGACAPLVIGAMKGAVGLQTALVIITPLYAVGGLIMWFAVRTYPADLAFVAAESRRLRDQ